MNNTCSCNCAEECGFVRELIWDLPPDCSSVNALLHNGYVNATIGIITYGLARIAWGKDK